MFKIYETFSSIQGESTYAGLPCFFIRLAGCNLRCAYCDTEKAWNFDNGKEMSLDEIISLALKSGLKLVEVTGGEPLANDKTPMLCEKLLEHFFKVLVETNGSYDISVLPSGVVRIVDYKTPSSGESENMFEDNFRILRPVDEVKFVISDLDDYAFARSAIKKFDLPSQTENILLSPVFGIMNPKTLVEKMLADDLPARINLQLHKIIWGADSEGV